MFKLCHLAGYVQYCIQNFNCAPKVSQNEGNTFPKFSTLSGKFSIKSMNFQQLYPLPVMSILLVTAEKT